MQNLIDFFAAGFVFLLFASVYRKRSTAAVRCWMSGWLFVLLHFATALCHPLSDPGQSVQSISALGSLILAGIAFVLSREESQRDKAQRLAVAVLLGLHGWEPSSQPRCPVPGSG